MQEISALAASAGSALVDAAATDAWQSARVAFARLLAGGDARQERLMRARLDRTAADLAHAGPTGRAAVARRHEHTWTVRLTDFLEERPEARDGLAALVREIRKARSSGGTVTAIATGAVQQTTFGGIGVANTGVVTGDIHIDGDRR